MSMGNTSIAPVVVKQCQVNLTRLSSIQMADTDEASQVNAFGQDVEYGAVSDGPRLDIEGSSDVEIRCDDNKDDDDGIDGVANCDISYADVNDDENATSETKKDAPSFSAESISDVEMVKVGGRKKQRPIRKFRPTMSKMQELSQRQNNEFVISSGALNEESYLRQTEWLKNYKISKKFIPICSYCLADIESPSALEKNLNETHKLKCQWPGCPKYFWPFFWTISFEQKYCNSYTNMYTNIYVYKIFLKQSMVTVHSAKILYEKY